MYMAEQNRRSAKKKLHPQCQQGAASSASSPSTKKNYIRALLPPNN